MPVSGVIVEVKTGAEARVSERLAALEGVEVAEVGRGSIVVTTDTATIAADRQLTGSLGDLPEVLAVNVAFTSMEDCLADGEQAKSSLPQPGTGLGR